MNPITEFKQKGYIKLDNQTRIDLPNYHALVNAFEGYQKVVYTILMRYFDLPSWPTFLFYDLNNEAVMQALKEFLAQGEAYFIRTDTYKNIIDNQGVPLALRNEVLGHIQQMKKVEQRFILVLHASSDPNQVYKNNANCRMGMLNGQEVQEWVGPGFAEYHLAKDKFPRKATVHANYQGDFTGTFKPIYIAHEQKFIQDIADLYFSIGIGETKIRKQIFDRDYFKSLVGYEYAGKEPTNDEILMAFGKWRDREAQKLGVTLLEIDNQFIAKGRLMHRNFGPNYPLNKLLASGAKNWQPPQEYIDQAHKYLIHFIDRSKRLDIDPEGKILSFSFSNDDNWREQIVFWDIHNLVL